jgi:putative transposase
MRKSRFPEEQIIRVLKEHAAGLSASDVRREHGISDAAFYKWRSRFGGMELSDARKLKASEGKRDVTAACRPHLDWIRCPPGSEVGTEWRRMTELGSGGEREASTSARGSSWRLLRLAPLLRRSRVGTG